MYYNFKYKELSLNCHSYKNNNNHCENNYNIK